MPVIVRDLSTLKLIAQSLEYRLPVGSSLQAIRWAINEIEELRRRNVASTVECPICLEQVRRAELYCHKCEEG